MITQISTPPHDLRRERNAAEQAEVHRTEASRGVAEHCGTVRDQQEVDAARRHIQRALRRRANCRARDLEEELASARQVEVAARLVRARVHAERDEDHAGVLGRRHVRTAVHERRVAVEEARLERRVERHAVHLERQLGDVGSELWHHHLKPRRGVVVRVGTQQVHLGTSECDRCGGHGLHCHRAGSTTTCCLHEERHAADVERRPHRWHSRHRCVRERQDARRVGDGRHERVRTSRGDERRPPERTHTEMRVVGLRHRGEAVPVVEVRAAVRARAVVRCDLHAGHDQHHRPLELLQQELARRRAHRHRLAAVHVDQHEAHATHEDLVNLRVHEDVVHVEVDADVRDRRRTHGAAWGGERTRTTRVEVHQLRLLGQQDLDVALPARQRRARHRRRRALVEPEAQRHEQLHRLTSRRQRTRGLEAVQHATRHTVGDRRVHHAVGRPRRLLVPAALLHLLADAPRVSLDLVRRNEDLAVEVDVARRVVVERVAVDLEGRGLDQALAHPRAPAVQRMVARHGRRDAAKRERGAGHRHVHADVAEEVAEHGDIEKDLIAEGSRAEGALLVVLEEHGHDGAESSMGDQKMRTLDISDGRGGVTHGRVLGAGSLDGADAAMKQISGIQEGILLAGVVDESKDTCAGHG